MAMVLTVQKPKQRDRDGEVSEGLPGSTLERGTCREKRRELGRPEEFLLYQCIGISATGEQVDKPKQKVGESRTFGSQISS